MVPQTRPVPQGRFLMNVRTALRLTAVLFLLACSVVLASDEPDRERLDDRIGTYWDAIRIRDLATAYALEWGSVDGTLTASAFRERWDRSTWDVLGFKVMNVEMQGGEATLDVALVLLVPELAKPLTRTRPERWVFSKGDWFRAPAAPAP